MASVPPVTEPSPHQTIEQKMGEMTFRSREELASIKITPQSNEGDEHTKPTTVPDRLGATSTTEYVTGMKLFLVLASITIVTFLVMLDATVLATATPFITDEFQSLVDVGWYGSAYQLSSAAVQPLTGKVYLRLETRRSFLAFLLLFEAGSAICGAAQSSAMLIVGRAVAGVGGAGLVNGGLIILNSCVPPQRQPALLGTLISIGQLGMASGPLIGGALTEYTTWRWCFYLNLPAGGLVALGLAFIHIPNNVPKPAWWDVLRKPFSEFDLLGFAIFAPAVIMIFLALQYGGNQFSWNSPTVIGLFCGGGMTSIFWLVWNGYQADKAMIPFSMVRKRQVWASFLTGFFLAGSIFVTTTFIPLYFQAVLGVTPLKSGVYVLPDILSRMLFGVLSGIVVQRFGFYYPFAISGTALNVLGCGLLGLVLPGTPTGQWIGFQIIYGAGRGLSLAMPLLVMQNAVPRSQVPATMSLQMFGQYFGASVLTAIGGTILSNSLRETIPLYAPNVDPKAVIAAGLTTVRSVVSAADLDDLLFAYAKSLDRVFYFAAGGGLISLVASLFIGGVDVRGKKDEDDHAT